MLDTKNLRWGAELNSAANITEVAIRHGLDPTVEDEFYKFVSDSIRAHIDYRMWEDAMGDDL